MVAGEKKFKLSIVFKKEERIGFITETSMDEIVKNDEMADTIERFTRGYNINPNWHSLRIIVEDVQKTVQEDVPIRVYTDPESLKPCDVCQGQGTVYDPTSVATSPPLITCWKCGGLKEIAKE